MAVLSAEERQAADVLHDAVTGYFKAFDLLDDGQIVTSWLVVGAGTCDDEDDTRISFAHPNGSQPAHIVAGLLAMGRHLMFDHGDDD